jgi:hypothetical protein
MHDDLVARRRREAADAPAGRAARGLFRHSRATLSRVKIIPRDALESDFFESVPHDESLEAFVTFDPPLTRSNAISRAFGGRDDHQAVALAVDEWAARVAPDKSIAKEADSTTFRIGVVGVDDPRAAMRSLVEAVQKTGFGVREVVFLRRTIDEDGIPGSTVDDPRMLATEDVGSEDEFWSASFDLARTPPPVEDPAGMFSMLQMKDGSMVMELRVSLHIPDVRVSYGLVEVDDRPSDARSGKLSKRVAGALRSSFGGKPPDFYDREARAGGIDCIARGDRKGYAFAFQRDDLLASMVGRFRYREYELLMAMREVVLGEKLAPVVHWLRDSVYIVNLWQSNAN